MKYWGEDMQERFKEIIRRFSNFIQSIRFDFVWHAAEGARNAWEQSVLFIFSLISQTGRLTAFHWERAAVSAKKWIEDANFSIESFLRSFQWERPAVFIKKWVGDIGLKKESFLYSSQLRIEHMIFLAGNFTRFSAGELTQILQDLSAFFSSIRERMKPLSAFLLQSSALLWKRLPSLLEFRRTNLRSFLLDGLRQTSQPMLKLRRAGQRIIQLGKQTLFSIAGALLACWRGIFYLKTLFSLGRINAAGIFLFFQRRKKQYIVPPALSSAAAAPAERVEGATISSAGQAPLIRLERVSVVYDMGKSNETRALSDISLEVYPGEYVTFFGPSGCGKSTLLYAIAGLERTTAGKIQVEGKELTRMNAKELIWFHRTTLGMVFQAYYLIPNLSVRDNIMLPQVFAGVPSQKRERRVQELMEKFGIADFAARKPSMLSGGQQQRTSIARALVNNPSIIFADEPVGNLDSKNADIVLKLLEEINRKDGKTVVHVTHNPRDLHYANRVFFMRDGKIERVVRNAGKPGPSRLTPERISELDQLAQAYPYLTESRLRSKLILHHLLLPYAVDIQQRIEETIENFILNNISKAALFHMLNTPQEKGGAGLYVQRARELSENIGKLVEEIKMISQEPYPTLTPLEERAQNLRGYLLDGYKGKLSFDQVKRLEDVLLSRLLGKISNEEFARVLDLPFREKGVGLNSRTARRFAREIELILMKE